MYRWERPCTGEEEIIAWSFNYCALQKFGYFSLIWNQVIFFWMKTPNIDISLINPPLRPIQRFWVSGILHMPRRLSNIQRDVAETMLRQHIAHETIAKEVKCSISHVKRMSSNLRNYGSITQPGVKVKGRPREIHHAAVVVCIPDPFWVDLINRHFMLFLPKSRMHTSTKWQISFSMSLILMFRRLRCVVLSNGKRYHAKT